MFVKLLTSPFRALWAFTLYGSAAIFWLKVTSPFVVIWVAGSDLSPGTRRMIAAVFQLPNIFF